MIYLAIKLDERIRQMKSEKSELRLGRLMAFITIMIWGTTFISTKILLESFTPVEILFYRFIISFLALSICYPRRLKVQRRKHELMFAAAGLCGVTMYQLLENTALTYTAASNVGIIVSISPFFTAMLAQRLLEGEKLEVNFFIGFVAAITGIALISFNGKTSLEFNLIGELLATLAAAAWAIYSILSRKISQYGYNAIQVTRRIFFYGLLFMTPVLFFSRFEISLERFKQPVNLFNILFLGMIASAACFVTWNLAVKYLGAVKTSVYIYLIPVVTVITSMLILGEKLTWVSGCGMGLTLTGLFISERKAGAPRSAAEKPVTSSPKA